MKLLEWLSKSLPQNSFLLSLLSQYTPVYRTQEYPEINRRVTTYEYNKVLDKAIALGLNQGFMQERSSASSVYTPSFQLEGLYTKIIFYITEKNRKVSSLETSGSLKINHFQLEYLLFVVYNRTKIWF